jgi:hypothetical protein
MLIVGHKPRVDWPFLRTYSLQNYFHSFSFILVFISFVLFKRLSYSLLFPNFRWLILATQSRRALDVSPLSASTKECATPTRAATRLPSARSLGGGLLQDCGHGWQEKTHKKLNSYRRMTSMTMRRKKTMRKKKRATRLKMNKMNTTLLGAVPRRTRRSTMPMRSKLLEMKPRSQPVD